MGRHTNNRRRRIFGGVEVKVSVVIPTMNEEKTIGITLKSIPKSKGITYEKIIVDTDSRDKTIEIAKKYKCRIINEPRRGYGRAYKTGIPKANGEIIVCMDGDYTYPENDIPKLIKIMKEKNLNFITCSRFPKLDKDSMPKLNYFGNKFLTLLCNFLFNTKFKDTQSGMWLLKRNILPHLT